MKYKNLHKLILLGTCCSTLLSPTFSQPIDFDWAKQFSGLNQDESATAFGIALDAQRNNYTVGSFSGTVDFDPGSSLNNLSSFGGIYFNVFVTKLDIHGKLVWARQMGGTSGAEGYSIATDREGNVYTTGYFQGVADFDPGTPVHNLSTDVAEASIFISKLDTDGKFVWARQIGDGSWDAGSSITTDAEGNIYVSGQFDGTVDFDPGQGVTSLTATGDNDVFILKLNSSGNLIWARQLGAGPGNIENKAIAVDLSGNVLTTGTFSGTLDFDPGSGNAPLSSSGWNSIYISKLDAAGNFLFAKKIGGAYGSSGNAIATDAQGNIITAGYFSSTVDFDPGTGISNLSSSGPGIDFDIFVSKLDPAGNFKWASKIGGTSFEDCKALSLDPRGNVYITGYFSGTTDFDPGSTTYPLTSSGSDIYIAKLDTAGNFVWAKSTGKAASDNSGLGRGIIVDPSSNIYTTGEFGGFMDFDPGSGVFNMDGGLLYSNDAFVHRLFCSDTSSARIQMEVCQDSIVFLGQTINTSGLYTFVVPNAAGCDSTIVLALSIKGYLSEPIINVNGFELSTTTIFPVYQWLRNGNLIPGAVNRTYVVVENGDYTVAVSNTISCSDTSAVYTVNNVTTIDQQEHLASQIHIYPNPATDDVNITSPTAVNISIYSMDGKKMLEAQDTKKLAIKHLAKGIYLLRLTDQKGHLLKIEKMVKQ